MEEIFISYSDFDKEKINLILKELDGNIWFKPLVIAENREALKPLAEKVKEGIIKTKIIIPLLTKKSFKTQWINQEIGFATALKKRVIPIVAKDIIGKLKGFVHKEIDLPYNYLSSLDKDIENKDFINCFRLLISDLEKDFEKFRGVTELPKKTEFQKSLEKVDELNAELNFKKEREKFLESEDGFEDAKLDVINMYSDIKLKIVELHKKRFYFGYEEETYRPSFILKCEGFSFSIALSLKYDNSLKDSTLYVKYWKGALTQKEGAYYFPGDEPEFLSERKYDFDRDRQGTISWKNRSDKKNYTGEEIVDSCLSWLIEQVGKKRLGLNQ